MVMVGRMEGTECVRVGMEGRVSVEDVSGGDGEGGQQYPYSIFLQDHYSVCVCVTYVLMYI